eukprot:5140741-Alexandrium_andersonii.AAC.1
MVSGGIPVAVIGMLSNCNLPWMAAHREAPIDSGTLVAYSWPGCERQTDVTGSQILVASFLK